MTDPVMKSASSDTGNSSQTSLVVYAVVAIGLALFIRFFVAAPYIVSGASMEPAFHDLHYLIVDRISYDLGEPQRGDVVVFDLPQNTSRALIKRVIGLPGETVQLDGNSVTIINASHPEGFTLLEPYLETENLGGSGNITITLKSDEYFVLGDNRRVSADSRLWGALPKEDIVGRVFVRLFPFTQISLLPGEARYAQDTEEQPIQTSATNINSL
jgi:signal peptidase I